MTTALLDERRLEQAVRAWSEDCGKRLQEKRRSFRWNQEQLAELVGVRKTSISKFELGLVTPREPVKLAIACALSCEVADLWPSLSRNYVMSVSRVVAA